MRLFLKCKSGVILRSEQITSEQSSFEQARTELFIAPLWDCLEWSKAERRSVTSCYHGSKISGPQQSFLTKTAICRLSNGGWKAWATISFRECNHVRESHTCRLFRFSFHLCRNIVCWDPEILLPWQRDVKTSLLYADLHASTLCLLNETEEQKQ